MDDEVLMEKEYNKMGLRHRQLESRSVSQTMQRVETHYGSRSGVEDRSEVCMKVAVGEVEWVEGVVVSWELVKDLTPIVEGVDESHCEAESEVPA